MTSLCGSRSAFLWIDNYGMMTYRKVQVRTSAAIRENLRYELALAAKHIEKRSVEGQAAILEQSINRICEVQ